MIRFIYAYFDQGCQPVYVGSAFNVAKRDVGHWRHGKSRFDSFLRKTGRANFTLEILEAFSVRSRGEMSRLSDARETHWIEMLHTSYKYGGQNIVTPAGQGQLVCSQEKYEAMCRKLSEAASERKLSEECRQNIRAALKGRTCPEISERMRGNKFGAAGKGRIFSEEHCRKLSEANRGRTLSEEHRRKIGEASLGYKHTEEARRKIAEASHIRAAAARSGLFPWSMSTLKMFWKVVKII